MKKENAFSPVDYSKLIALIYDTAQDTSLWPELLEEIWAYANADASEDKDLLFEPHITRALAMNQRMTKLETKNNTSNQILNRLPIGVLVVNQDLEILASNDRASIVLNHGQILSNHHGTIASPLLEKTKQLHQLVRAYASSHAPEKGASLFLEGNDGSNIALWITASDQQITEITGDSEVAIIYIASSLIQPEIDVQTIQDQFHLTIAEATLVKALTNGCHNLNDAAEKLGVSIHTVRTQIKHAFEKLERLVKWSWLKRCLPAK
jgi:predicted DNA-binding protein (UPF0251 family)